MAVAVGSGDADGRDGGRGTEVAVGTEDLVLRPLLEDRGDLEDVGGRERQGPAGGGAAAGDLGDHAVEGGQAELVAAVPARLEHSVEAGPQEVVVSVLGVVRQPFRLRLALQQHGPQVHSPFDDVTFGQSGFGRGSHDAS